jgi:serine phosphatase RsbU (regulator of sigma subunit)
VGQELNIAILSNNIGSIFLETKQYDKALEYFHTALEIYQKREMPMYEGIILGNIGNVYKERGLLQDALEFHKKALAIYETTDNTYQLVHCYLNLGEMYFSLGQDDKAQRLLEKFLSLTRENPVIDLELKAYNILSKLSENQHNWKQALGYTKSFYTLKDSLFNINKHKQISEIEAKYQNEKKSREITALKHEAVLDQSKIQRQRLVILFTVIIAGLVLVYTFFLIRQNKEIRRIYSLLSRKQKDLTDSIVYAEKIQQAVLPSAAYITSLLPEHFVIYKPKSIVGGDFYWLATNERYIFLAVSDCTGHGVPGGFLSMLGITFLNQLIIAYPDARPSKIVNELNSLIYKSLNPKTANYSSREGMDVGLCRIDRATGEIFFAGSRIPLLYTVDGKVNRLKGEVWPLGYLSTSQNLFKDKLVPVAKGEMVYLYTDGYIHQYGEEENQKFGQKRFMNKLQEIHNNPLDLQKVQLEARLKDWQGAIDQFDDILVFGMRAGKY